MTDVPAGQWGSGGSGVRVRSAPLWTFARQCPMFGRSAQALFEQRPFGGIAGHAERYLVAVSGVVRAIELTQQFGTRGVVEVVAVQVPGQRVDLVQRRLRPLDPTERDRPVQSDHGAGSVV